MPDSSHPRSKRRALPAFFLPTCAINRHHLSYTAGRAYPVITLLQASFKKI
ncbi:hypothetical protein CBM2637_A170453 [Cupriavidus taiwanensis]|nr:hypothetical protein CBM2637_A170453 [Cupriavidus taiwanensis]